MNWSDDLRGRSSSALHLSGELGADAIVEEVIRNGDDMSGSTGLRLPRPREDSTAPLAVPALLTDCGVTKFCTARLSDDFWSLEDPVVDENDRPRSETLECSVGVVSEGMGELCLKWYDIACDSASGS